MQCERNNLSTLRNSLRTAFIHHPRSQSPSSDVLETASTTTNSLNSSPTSSIRNSFYNHKSNKRRSISPSAIMHSASASASSSPSSSSLRRGGLRLRSPFLLRRRPSAVDLAMEEERYRAQGDQVERTGLGLMEPRPVPVVQAAPSSSSLLLFPPTSFPSSTFGALDGMMMEHDVFANARHHVDHDDVFGGMKREREEEMLMMGLGSGFGRPFVMGGIFEVMEGTC